jgi:streptogramin lyase
MVKFVLTSGSYSIISSNTSVPLFVGYGTSNPRYTLDIQGNVNINGTLYNNNTIFTGGGGGATTPWNLFGSNIYYTLGNVGIGTTIPMALLDIQKTRIKSNTLFISQEQTNESFRIDTLGTDYGLRINNTRGTSIECNSNAISFFMNSNTVEPMRITTNGWVGIGTNQPRQKLHIEGSCITQRLGIGTHTPSHRVHVYSTSSNNNDYESAGILLENSGIGEVGISFYNSNIRASGNVWAIGFNRGNTRVDINYGSQTTEFNDNDVRIGISATGEVGIGTTIPGAFGLAVYGDLNITSNVISTGFMTTGYMDVQGIYFNPYSPILYNSFTSSWGFTNYISKTLSFQTNSWWVGSTTLTYSSNASVSASPGNGLYTGATLLNDGQVLFIPYYSASFDIYNPYTNVFTRNPSIIGSAVALFSGGVLLPDGRVVCVPNYSGYVGIYNPYNNTMATVGTFIPAGSYVGGVLVPDGRVIFTPHNNTYIGVYNPSTNTYSTISISSTGFYKFAGSVLTATGKVVFVPYDADHVGIFDPVTNGYSIVGTGFGVGNNLYFGGVLLPNGNVLFVPYNCTYYGFYNPTTNVFSTRTGVGLQGTGTFRGGVLTSDGRVIMVSHGTTYFGLYNTNTDVFSTFIYGGTANASGSTFIGGVLTSEGSVVVAPFFGGEIGVLSLFPRVPLEICQHPCFNKL